VVQNGVNGVVRIERVREKNQNENHIREKYERENEKGKR
jgi:hypothetical protein